MEYEEAHGDPLVVGSVLRRRKWWGILALLGCFSAVASIVAFLPDVYQSTTTVVIERQQIPDSLVRSTVTGALESRLQTLSQEILGRSHLEELIARVGIYQDLTRRMPMERVVEQMRDKIKIDFKGESVGRSETTAAFTITFTGRDPRQVALVVNALATSYVEENLKFRKRQAAGTADFLRSQLEEMRRKLEDQESQVSHFKERYGGQLPQQLDVSLKTVDQLNTQLRLNNDNQIRVTERRAALLKQMSVAGGGAGTPDTTANRLAQLRQTLAALRTQYSEKYPEVIRVKSEVEALERQLGNAPDGDAQEKAAADNPLILETRRAIAEQDAELKRLKAEEANLRGSLAQYRQRVETAPKHEQEFQSLSRNYETTKELYRSLAVQQQEAEVAEEMEQRRQGEQFRIIDPAVPAAEPAAPRRLPLMGLGLALCLGVAGAVMFARELLDASFHTAEELQAHSKPVVVVNIPRIVTTQDKHRQRLQFALAVASSVVGLGLIVGGSYLVARENLALTARLLK